MHSTSARSIEQNGGERSSGSGRTTRLRSEVRRPYELNEIRPKVEKEVELLKKKKKKKISAQ
jgi:hypothetical protein